MLMDMSKKLIESLNKEIKSLMNKDFNLRKSLEKLEKDLTVDDIEIEKLKKEKLKIKDKILAKQNECERAAFVCGGFVAPSSRRRRECSRKTSQDG
jgi:uncharacterized protein YdcH (DUF465 family)